MSAKAAAVGMLCAAALLAGCDDNPYHLTSGTVMSKRYDAEQHYFVMTCISYGKYGCLAYIPRPETTPPDWSIVIRNCERYNANPVKHQTCDDGRIHLDPGDYSRYMVGGEYP